MAIDRLAEERNRILVAPGEGVTVGHRIAFHIETLDDGNARQRGGRRRIVRLAVDPDQIVIAYALDGIGCGTQRPGLRGVLFEHVLQNQVTILDRRIKALVIPLLKVVRHIARIERQTPGRDVRIEIVGDRLVENHPVVAAQNIFIRTLLDGIQHVVQQGFEILLRFRDDLSLRRHVEITLASAEKQRCQDYHPYFPFHNPLFLESERHAERHGARRGIDRARNLRVHALVIGECKEVGQTYVEAHGIESAPVDHLARQ